MKMKALVLLIALSILLINCACEETVDFTLRFKGSCVDSHSNLLKVKCTARAYTQTVSTVISATDAISSSVTDQGSGDYAEWHFNVTSLGQETFVGIGAMSFGSATDRNHTLFFRSLGVGFTYNTNYTLQAGLVGLFGIVGSGGVFTDARGSITINGRLDYYSRALEVYVNGVAHAASTEDMKRTLRLYEDNYAAAPVGEREIERGVRFGVSARQLARHKHEGTKAASLARWYSKALRNKKSQCLNLVGFIKNRGVVAPTRKELQLMEKDKTKTPGEMDVAKEKERMDSLNLATLQRIDDKIVKVLGNAGHVALYTFHADKQEWERKEVEGSLFIASRSIPPYQQVVVLNRLNTDNFIEPITPDLEMEIVQPYLMFRNKKQEITGVWFYKKAEQTKISEVIQGLMKGLTEKPNPPKVKQQLSNGSSSPAPDQRPNRSSQNDNVNNQKDNRYPVAEQNSLVKDNQGGAPRRGSGIRRSGEREDGGTAQQGALRISSNGTTKPKESGDQSSKQQQPQQPPQQPQQLPSQLTPPSQSQQQQQQQLHNLLFSTPPHPYPNAAYPYPQQPPPLQFPTPQYPYHHHPPHPYPQYPFPMPLHLSPSAQTPPPSHPHTPQPSVRPPPGFSSAPSPSPSPQVPYPQQPTTPSQPQAPQQPPQQQTQRLLSPEFFVQQLARPPSTPTTAQQQPQKQPPVTKEGIKELLATLVQDERFISMVYEAYLQQTQKGDS